MYEEYRTILKLEVIYLELVVLNTVYSKCLAEKKPSACGASWKLILTIPGNR